MAYLDALATFSSAQAVTTTALSTNQIDLGATNTLKDIGAGRQLFLVVSAASNITDASGTDDTLTISLESDSVVTIDSSATVHASSGAIAVGSGIAAGTVLWVIPLPLGKRYERYVSLRYTVSTALAGTSTIDAYLTECPQNWAAYDDAITIV